MNNRRIIGVILIMLTFSLIVNYQTGLALQPSQADPPIEEGEKELQIQDEFLLIEDLGEIVQLEDLKPNEGMTETNGCMQDVAGFGLNCSANDVQLAGVALDEEGNPLLRTTDDGCAYLGDTVDFTATFEVVLNSKERHDIGIYFATDGDPNFDGAISGECSISTMPYYPEPDYLDLDGMLDPYPGENKPSGVQDICGDIDDSNSPLLYEISFEGVVCQDSDGDGFLNLPYCTSWRQPGANELCTSPLAAYPGAPSKCRCDEGFNVPIKVPIAELLVTKTAIPNVIDEPGENVTFFVEVQNTGIDPDNFVTLTSLTDDKHGDITTTGHDGITETICTLSEPIAGYGGTYICWFKVDFDVDAGIVGSETDIVTAAGIDANGHAIDGSDDATVTFNDVLPTVELTKAVTPGSLDEPGGDFTFILTIHNTSVEPVTITALTDDNPLSSECTGLVGDILAAGASTSCSYTVTHTEAGIYNNNASVRVQDNELNEASDEDSTSVEVTNGLPSVELTKIADPLTLDEPGGVFTFTLTIHNTSVEPVEITALTDDNPLSAECLALVNTTLAALGEEGSSTSCTYTVEHNDAGTYDNTASVIVQDNELNTGSDDDSASVTVNDVLPTASLSKDAVAALVTFEVQVCNDSIASTDPLTINTLSDDVFGNLLDGENPLIQDNDCTSLDGAVIPYGECSLVCSFKGMVEATGHIDTITAGVSDDEGNPLSPSGSAFVNFGIYLE